MLGQLEGLALVVGTSVAVEAVGDLEAVEEVELEEGLAVFDEEGDVVGADLEDGAGAAGFAEAVVEETGVVGAQLADADVVGGHDGGELGGDADALLAGEDVELLGLDDQAAALGGVDGFEEVEGVVGLFAGEVEDVGVAAGAPADGVSDLLVGGEGDAHGEACVHGGAGEVDGLAAVVEEERGGLMQGVELVAFDAGFAAREAELVEGEAGPQADGEGAGDDLEVEGAAVAGAHGLEAVGPVGEEAGEDVEAAGGGLGVALGLDVGGEVEGFEQGDEVAVASLEDGALAQLEAEEGQLLEALGDRATLGEEAGADPMAVGSQAQVEGGGLDLGFLDVPAGPDGALVEEGLDLLADEDSLGLHGGEYSREPGRRQGDLVGDCS